MQTPGVPRQAFIFWPAIGSLLAARRLPAQSWEVFCVFFSQRSGLLDPKPWIWEGRGPSGGVPVLDAEGRLWRTRFAFMYEFAYALASPPLAFPSKIPGGGGGARWDGLVYDDRNDVSRDVAGRGRELARVPGSARILVRTNEAARADHDRLAVRDSIGELTAGRRAKLSVTPHRLEGIVTELTAARLLRFARHGFTLDRAAGGRDICNTLYKSLRI